MKLGFLYAGQGSQHPGMGADLYEEYPAFRQVYHESEVAFDLCQVSFQDPEGLLNQTRYTQPCMVAFAAGLTAVLRENTPRSTPPVCSTPKPPWSWRPFAAAPWSAPPPAWKAP